MQLILTVTICSAVLLQSSMFQSHKRGSVVRSVRFDKVPVEENGVLRFAAVDNATGGNISIEEWIYLLSDPDSSDLMQKMVTVLKVSEFSIFCCSRSVFLCAPCSERDLLP